MVDCVRFQLSGYELELVFIVVDDAMGLEDFLLSRNFLRTYQVLVELTAVRNVVQAPVKPVRHHAHTQVGDSDSAVPVTLPLEVEIQTFERKVARATVVTNNLEPLILQNVALNASISDVSLHDVIF